MRIGTSIIGLLLLILLIPWAGAKMNESTITRLGTLQAGEIMKHREKEETNETTPIVLSSESDK